MSVVTAGVVWPCTLTFCNFRLMAVVVPFVLCPAVLSNSAVAPIASTKSPILCAVKFLSSRKAPSHTVGNRLCKNLKRVAMYKLVTRILMEHPCPTPFVCAITAPHVRPTLM